jgi:hypothetical protein
MLSVLLALEGGTYGMQMGSPEVAFTKPYEDSYNIHGV